LHTKIKSLFYLHTIIIFYRIYQIELKQQIESLTEKLTSKNQGNVAVSAGHSFLCKKN